MKKTFFYLNVDVSKINLPDSFHLTEKKFLCSFSLIQMVYCLSMSMANSESLIFHLHDVFVSSGQWYHQVLLNITGCLNNNITTFVKDIQIVWNTYKCSII